MYNFISFFMMELYAGYNGSFPDTIIDVVYKLTYKMGKEIIPSEIIVIDIGEVLGFEFVLENRDSVYEKDVIDIAPSPISLP